MSAIVPDGIVAFFTSYVYMENIVASWYEQVSLYHWMTMFLITVMFSVYVIGSMETLNPVVK